MNCRTERVAKPSEYFQIYEKSMVNVGVRTWLAIVTVTCVNCIQKNKITYLSTLESVRAFLLFYSVTY